MNELIKAYPQRSSDLVSNLDSVMDIEPLHLTDVERGELMAFESELFDRFSETSNLVIAENTIYPEAFTSEEGKQKFLEFYFGEDSQKPRLDDADTETIKVMFAELDLSQVPAEKRKEAHNYSADWARENFFKAFSEAKGDISKIENPVRVVRVIDQSKLHQKESGLRNLKREVKQIKTGIEGDNSLSEAKRIVADMYRKRINVSLAGIYEFKGVSPRSLQRIDHFLNGIGEGFDDNGFFKTIPDTLESYASSRVTEIATETEGYQKYNHIRVNVEQAVALANLILDEYGLKIGENKWHVVVRKNNTPTMGVQYKKDETTVREVRIPKDYSGGLIGTLAVLAHEIEGHVVRYVNKESAFKGTLRLVEESSTGRGDILSEGAAMYVEAESQNEMVSRKRFAEPYYFLGIKERMNRGSFKEVFGKLFEAYVTRKRGQNPQDFWKSKEGLDSAFEYSYSRALRIFRRNTPLNDTSGMVTTSDTLDYLEQELVLQKLLSGEPSKGEVSKIPFVAGPDLFSMPDLLRLGVLDLSGVELPKMVTARKIWPKLKQGLDLGKSIQEIITE